MNFFIKNRLSLETVNFISFVFNKNLLMRTLLVISLLAFSSLVQAEGLKAFFSYSSFYSPDSGPYVETYLSVIGSSVEYKVNENGKFQGKIEITLVFKDGEEIANFKKYNLLSPELDDTISSFINFVDQQRFSLANKKYELEIQIADVNSQEESFISYQPIDLNFSETEIMISDIEFVESFAKSETESIITKSGYDVVPYVSNFYPQNLNKIGFYAEVYNTEKVLGADEKYLVNYYIESYQTGSVMARYKKFARHDANAVSVVMGEFNIEELPSGNYQLVVEVRDRNNEIKTTKKMFFQRNNPAIAMNADDIAAIVDLGFVAQITDEDTLTMYIESLYPISSQLERNFVKTQFERGDGAFEMKQKYFISFWQSINRLNPERAWNEYKVELRKVERYRTTRFHGFETHRGRVYLQYGAPNTISDRKNDPATYPYEIWHYYNTEKRRNVKFVFYSPNALGIDYELIHSDAYGEPNNYRWKLLIQKTTEPATNPDKIDPRDAYGNRVDDYFDNPR
ncbi:MAG: GWxTD domain-containing protein [Flavobacteriales bacterium]|nr:GWxTD domain-containing protein [Flavobacteriales bacterium]